MKQQIKLKKKLCFHTQKKVLNKARKMNGVKQARLPQKKLKLSNFFSFSFYFQLVILISREKIVKFTN